MRIIVVAITAFGYYLTITASIVAFVPQYQLVLPAPPNYFLRSNSKNPFADVSSLLRLQAVLTDEEVTVKPSSSFRSMMTNQTISYSSSLTSPSSLLLFLEPPTTTTSTTTTHGPPLSDSTLDTTTTNSNLPAWFQSIAWRSLIVLLCALWASNFAAAKLVMAEPGVDSSLYALSRFGVAASALLPFAWKHWKRANIDADTLQQTLVCGLWVALGYLGQTLGLLTTTASKSCVICSMHCVFVAVIAEYWRVQKALTLSTKVETVVAERIPSESSSFSKQVKFDVSRLLPAAIAVAGVAIVELKGAGGAPTIGDALSFAQPVGFGMGYLILERLMAKRPEAALPVSAIKLTVVAAASFLMFEVMPLLQGNDIALSIPDFTPILSSPIALGGILYTGLVTTALALWMESIAFAKVPATDASLILTTEPLFAAAFGSVALGETFGISDYVGAGLIVGACALSIFLEEPKHET
jgi:drug/metabolite transporter (DMT)-like permease